MNQCFGKGYKLCSQKVMDDLFKTGNKTNLFPFSLVHKLEVLNTKAAFQVTISVPKRNFKKAHDRNRIKRLIREAIRKNKLILEEPLVLNGKQMALFVIYRHNAELDYDTILRKTKKAFQLVRDSIEKDEK